MITTKFLRDTLDRNIEKRSTKLKIGIPKSLFYFDHYLLWESFFKALDCEIVISENTNKDILDYGVNNCSSDICLPVKVFHGHVHYLIDKVDYVFIPRYTSIEKNEFTCPAFCGLPDMIYLNLKKQLKIIEVKIHPHQSSLQTVSSLIEIAKTLSIPQNKVLDSYEKSLEAFSNVVKSNNDLLNNSDGLSIAVIGHPYMIYDDYLSMKLIKKLTNRNINVFTPENLDYNIKRKNASPFQDRVFWEVGFENLGSAFTYAQDKKINGIIYLTPFACGLDSIIIEFIERRFKSDYNIHFLKLTIDEHTGEAGFDTRIEAFLDMIG